MSVNTKCHGAGPSRLAFFCMVAGCMTFGACTSSPSEGVDAGGDTSATLDTSTDAADATTDVATDAAVDAFAPPPSDTGVTPRVDSGTPPPPGDGGTGPRACTTPMDCNGACSPMAIGCTCTTTPMGQRCSPTCTVAADCPPNGAGTVFECRSGVCAPAQGDGGTAPRDGGMTPADGGTMPRDGGAMPPPGDGGMTPPPGDGGTMPPPGDGGAMPPPGDGGMSGPRVCGTSADCTSACAPTARGCVCATTSMGQRCVPSCTVASDCPTDPLGTVFECNMGICAPARTDAGAMPPAPPDGGM